MPRLEPERAPNPFARALRLLAKQALIGQNRGMNEVPLDPGSRLTHGLSPRLRFRAAMILALAADAAQIVVFPLFAEGGASPADDVLDIAMAGVLFHLLGWHWEFLPAFLGELVPGADLVPFWTLAVLNVYRKWKQTMVADQPAERQRRVLQGN